VSTPGRERWILTVDLPATISNGGRFVARLLKHLGRVWGVKCVAVDRDTEVRRLQRIIDGLTERVAAQSELRTRQAETGNKV
jgi:hypothetical protein